MSVFGAPITNETLKQMRKYKGQKIRQEDRAEQAMKLIHAEDKNLRALQHVLDLKKEYGNGCSVLCMIYNATGDRLEIVEKQDWRGSIYKEEPPRTFENGQWITFLHTGEFPLGPFAARVYRGKTTHGQVRDFLVAWHSNSDSQIPSKAYTEVREKDHFPNHWSVIFRLLDNAEKITRDKGDGYCSSTVSIGGISSPEFIAVLKHEFD